MAFPIILATLMGAIDGCLSSVSIVDPDPAIDPDWRFARDQKSDPDRDRERRATGEFVAATGARQSFVGSQTCF